MKSLFSPIKACKALYVKIQGLINRNALQQIFNYGFSVGSAALVNLIPIFILVRLLSANEYAKIVLAKNSLYLVVSLAGFGISQSVIRWINLEKTSKVYINSLVGVSLFILPSTVFLTAMFWFLGNRVGLAMTPLVILLLLAIVSVQLIIPEIINWQRAEHKSGRYTLFTSLRGLLQAAAIVVGVYLFSSLSAYLCSLLISDLGFLIFILRIDTHFRQANHLFSLKNINFSFIKQMLSYGWPYSLVILNSILLNTLDRYMISFLATNQALVAYYDSAYLIASNFICLFTRAFNLYIFPSYMKCYNTEGETQCKYLIEKALSLYLWLGLVLVLITVALTKPLMKLLFPADFVSASSIALPVCLGILLNGMINSVTAGLNIKGKTWIVSVLSGIALLMNFLMNLYMIPRFGLNGAALSTFFAFFLQLIIAYGWSRSYLKIALPLPQIFSCVGLCMLYLYLAM